MKIMLDKSLFTWYYNNTMKIEYGLYDLSTYAPHTFMIGVYRDIHVHGGTMWAVCLGKWYFGIIFNRMEK